MTQRLALVALALAACRGGDHDHPAVGKNLAAELAGDTAVGGAFTPDSITGRAALVNFWSPS